MQDDHFSYRNCYQHGSCVHNTKDSHSTGITPRAPFSPLPAGVTKFSFSRTLHQLCVFPAVDIITFFSHALFPLHIFPRLVLVVCFPRFSLVHPVAVACRQSLSVEVPDFNLLVGNNHLELQIFGVFTIFFSSMLCILQNQPLHRVWLLGNNPWKHFKKLLR